MGVEQVYCFENRGEEIGVTLSHPHGQIYAYPYVTPRTGRMLQACSG
jgi:UDPglucose--hexose-1-phosphate uridylyltransferase